MFFSVLKGPPTNERHYSVQVIAVERISCPIALSTPLFFLLTVMTAERDLNDVILLVCYTFGGQVEEDMIRFNQFLLPHGIALKVVYADWLYHSLNEKKFSQSIRSNILAYT
ncbi:hypothetical protein M758_UG276600 [Ceratodon purpureus]|nr:hypothetical protein M758_UG276600 [Ceratodon purpureus]